MKIITRLFALMVVTAFIGCATSGGGGSSAASAGGSGPKLSDSDFKRMGVNKSGYGNSY